MILLLLGFCTLMLTYVFLIYPAAILLLSSLVRRKINPRWDEPPLVTMILAALNEAPAIAQKIENTLNLNYPQDKLDIIIVDDGSTDNTADIVNGFESPRITLIRLDRQSGKTAALNRAIEQAKGEVLVFTDANAMFGLDAISHLVSSFDIEGKVGVVCGELNYQQHPQAVSDEESRYWNLEILLKKAESNIGTLLGANGSIYALRKDLYKPLREDLISDFLTPLLLSREGFRTVYQPKAVSVEISTKNLLSEFRRKKRIIQRGLYGLLVHNELLNPLASGWLAFQLWSHKVFRWLTPIWLLGIFISSWGLRGNICFGILFVLQIIGYSASLTGIALSASGRQPGVLRLPAYALMALVAALCGVVGVLMGQKVVTWNPQR